MEDLIRTMADFTIGPNCHPDGCSNFENCPALRLGEKLSQIATSETDVSIALRQGIFSWRTSTTHIRERVGQLNAAVVTCAGWQETGKRAFEASSLSSSAGGFGKALVLVDAVTSRAASRVDLPKETVYLEEPGPMLPRDHEDSKDPDCSSVIC